MTAIAQALTRALVKISEVETLKQLVMISAVGLSVSLLMTTCGLEAAKGLL
jgi:hypothetical protein